MVKYNVVSIYIFILGQRKYVECAGSAVSSMRLRGIRFFLSRQRGISYDFACCLFFDRGVRGSGDTGIIGLVDALRIFSRLFFWLWAYMSCRDLLLHFSISL